MEKPKNTTTVDDIFFFVAVVVFIFLLHSKELEFELQFKKFKRLNKV